MLFRQWDPAIQCYNKMKNIPNIMFSCPKYSGKTVSKVANPPLLSYSVSLIVWSEEIIIALVLWNVQTISFLQKVYLLGIEIKQKITNNQSFKKNCHKICFNKSFLKILIFQRYFYLSPSFLLNLMFWTFGIQTWSRKNYKSSLVLNNRLDLISN